MARKIPEGEHRNKARTMCKLVNAVGEILQNEGHSKLGVNYIAKVAGVSKKLIYRYFMNVDNLIETYIKEKDYWEKKLPLDIRGIGTTNAGQGEDLIWSTLKDLVAHFEEYPETQKIILWQVSEKNKVLKESHRSREKLMSQLCNISGKHFSDLGIDLTAIFAVLLGGVHYMHLQAKSTGEPWCEMDINTTEDRERMLNGISTIIELCHREANKQPDSRPKLLKIKGGSG